MHVDGGSITHILSTWGYLAVFAAVAIESSGLPFPGETMLVTGAVYAGSGHLSIAGVILAAALGAIVGDNAGYLAGRYGGRRLVERYGKYIRIRPHHLRRAEGFFERYGDRTVFFGRFIAVLRAWAAFLAGVNRMPWPKFLVFNAAGGILWAVLYGTLGFELGHNLPLLHRVERVLGVGGIALAVVVVLALLIINRRRRVREPARRDVPEEVA
jgi:membrane protein DedA with SNARE-associated domain